MKMAIRNFFGIMSQSPPNPGFMLEKAQKGFSKKGLARIDFFFVLGSFKSPEGLER